MIQRKIEYFSKSEKIKVNSIVIPPYNCYYQERDWTCSIGCIRTALSCYKNISEDTIIKQENLIMGGQKIEDIVKWKCLKGIDIQWQKTRKVNNLFDLYKLLKDNYIIMCINTYNLYHYVLVYGYLTTNNRLTTDTQYVQFYDPYTDKHELMHAELFEAMWYNIKNKKYKEYLAIKQIKLD